MLTGKPDNPKGELTPRGRLSAWIESRPVQGLIRHFRPELEQRILERKGISQDADAPQAA